MTNPFRAQKTLEEIFNDHNPPASSVEGHGMKAVNEASRAAASAALAEGHSPRDARKVATAIHEQAQEPLKVRKQHEIEALKASWARNDRRPIGKK